MGQQKKVCYIRVLTNTVNRATTDAAGGVKDEGPQAGRPAGICRDAEQAHPTEGCVSFRVGQKTKNQNA
jgi:hypothetical protein